MTEIISRGKIAKIPFSEKMEKRAAALAPLGFGISMHVFLQSSLNRHRVLNGNYSGGLVVICFSSAGAGLR